MADLAALGDWKKTWHAPGSLVRLGKKQEPVTGGGGRQGEMKSRMGWETGKGGAGAWVTGLRGRGGRGRMRTQVSVKER